jgi:hypothetical protein
VSDISIKDMTGQLPTQRDVREAEAVVAKYLTIGLMKLPPELAVQLPNIHRCLKTLSAILTDAGIP